MTAACPRSSRYATVGGARTIAFAACCLAVFSGCQPEYDPPSLINKLRVLGVRAEPPQIRLTQTTQLDALVVGYDKQQPLCHAWALCFFALAKDGNYRCLDPDLQVDLGTSAAPTVSIGDVLAIAPKVVPTLTRLGFPVPEGFDLLKPPDPDPDPVKRAARKRSNDRIQARFQLTVLFKIATADEFGGTCPTDATAALATVCGDRTRCLAGYKRLAVAPTKEYEHSNPEFADVKLRGVVWPASLTPTVAPYVEKGDAFDQILEDGVDAELWEGYGPTALQITPSFTPQSKERVPEFRDLDGNVAIESLLMSWFSDDGKFEKNRTYDDFPDNLFLAPQPAKEVSDRTISIWVVLRDGRNGTAWIQRRVTIDAAAPQDAHPLCALDGTLLGCETVTPKG